MTFPLYETTTLLAAGSGPTFWLPEAASTIAAETDFVFNVINAVCYFFFALVTFLLVFFSWRYRQRGKEIRDEGPTHHTPLEVTWTVVPLIIVIVIFFMGFKSYLNFATPPRDTYDIEVVAAKWLWSFKYPNGAQSDDLYIPAGRPVRLIMRSEDVLHSLFIPQFRVKRDVVPGRYNQLWFQSDRPTGDDPSRAYDLYCTEYCGSGHSNMNRKVFVLDPVAFDEWVAKEAEWLDEIPEDELYFMAGPRLYARCSNCHSMDGSPGTGPSFKDLWPRTRDLQTRFTDGTTLASHVGPGRTFDSPEQYIHDSILNPGRLIVSGYSNAMPTFRGQLNDKAISALIGMMKNADQFDAKGQWKGASQ